MNNKTLIFNNANGEFDSLIANGYYFARSEGGATDPATLKFEAEQEFAANLVVIGRGEPATKYYFDIRDCFNVVVRREGFSEAERLDWLHSAILDLARRVDGICNNPEMISDEQAEKLDNAVTLLSKAANLVGLTVDSLKK